MTQKSFDGCKRFFRRAALLLAAVALFAPLSAEPVRIKSFKGNVQVQRAKTPGKWFPAKRGIQLEPGDAVKSGDKARADLQLVDGTKMQLRPKSQVKVQQTSPNRVMSLDFGRIKSFVNRVKNSKFEIRTPIAAASVRGTVFEVGFDAEKENGFLDVEKGAVALEQADKEVLVPA